MGKYLEDKKSIEDKMMEKIDGLVDMYNIRYEQLFDYAPAVRAEKIKSLVEDHTARISAEQEKAVYKMEDLFDDLSGKVLDVLSAPPSSSQLATLQAMSLKSRLSAGDIQAAAYAMEGNAIALSALADLCEKHSLQDTEVNGGFIPQLEEIQKGLEEYKRKSITDLRRYGKIDRHTGQVKSGMSMFIAQECTWEVFKQAERVLEMFRR